MKDIVTKGLLLDFYRPLLTERQRYCMEQHYENDLSLGEIAEELQISRQAVHDNLQRACTVMEDYEAKLHLLEQAVKRREIIAQVKALVEPVTAQETEINRLLEQL